MLNKKYPIIFLSAFFYFLGLHFDCLFFLVFFFLVPIFYYFLKGYTFSFLDGLLWGSTFYFLHFFSLFEIIYGISSFWFLIILILILYFSFWSGVWLFFLNKLCKKENLRIIGLLFTTNLYFFFINYWVLSFIEFGCGYSVNYPLNVINLDFGVFKEFYFFLVTLASLFLVLFLIQKKSRYVFLAVCVLVPFLLLKQHEHFLISDSECLSIKGESINPLNRALQIREKIEEALRKNPNIKNVFFPESTFPYPLNEFEYILNWWPKNINILLCGSWKKQNKISYRAFHVFNGSIIRSYKKRRLIPIFEYNPWFLDFISTNKYYSNINVIAGKKSGCFYVDGKKYRILICSDFFFESIWEKCDRERAIIFVNYNWLNDNFRKLLLRTVRAHNVLAVF